MTSRAHRTLLVLILFLGLGLRLYHITYPYLDHHSWRQTDTAAIARNFYRHGLNILKPEVDWAGAGPSTVELELQITPLLTAGLYALWGIQDWVGRIVPILFWLGALGYFYLLVKRLADEEVALFAAFAFAILPLGVFFTRVLMPESGATFFAIAAIYHFIRFVDTQRFEQYSLATLFVAMAFLTKLTNLLLLGPLAFAAWEGHKSGKVGIGRAAGLLAISLGLTVIYYAYMHGAADIRLIPYRLGADKWGNVTTWITPLFYQVIFARLHTVVYTWLGLLLLAIGVFLPVKTRVFHAWLVSVLAYVFLVATGNLVHSYYQMPLIAPGAFFIGLALHRIYAGRELRLASGVACGALVYLSLANLFPMYGLYAYPEYDAAMNLRQVDQADSLVLFVPRRPDINPEMLYYADRKGWVIWPRQVSIVSIEGFKEKGARYLVLPVPRYLSPDLKAYISGKTVWSDRNYLILRL